MAADDQKITTFLWFDDRAEEAAGFYASIFPDSRIGDVTRYTAESATAAGRPEGSTMTVEFELAGRRFVALNGGPAFRFNEAISLVVNCDGQDEIDHYWSRLSEGGDPEAQRCGWLKDRFGLSWQVVPSELSRLLNDPDPERARRAVEALLAMRKIDIEGLKRAAAGD